MTKTKMYIDWLVSLQMTLKLVALWALKKLSVDTDGQRSVIDMGGEIQMEFNLVACEMLHFRRSKVGGNYPIMMFKRLLTKHMDK